MATDTDRLALLAAVCADPGDDAPRLACADWLEEHGEADRAEFVRLQIELAPFADLNLIASGDAALARRVDALRRRERELLGTHWTAWSEPLGRTTFCDNLYEYKPTPTPCLRFARGFVESLTLTAADWLAHADALAWHPEQKCQECGGAGVEKCIVRGPGCIVRHPCPVCRGTGHRPCPPTAQPIRTVQFTDWPDTSALRISVSVDGVWSSPRWPGITFHLPKEN